MCSIAETSMPFGSCARHVSRASPRTWRTNAIAPARSANGTNARHNAGRDRQHAKRRLGYDAERAFAADKQIDEIHPRGCKVPRGQLGGLRHAVGGDRHAGLAAPGHDLEVAVGVGADDAALDVEHVSCRQHDGDGVDPVARRAVLERRRARGVCGDRAADRGAHEGWRRRIVAVRAAECLVELRRA